ncbi:MAG: hypothetical protein JST80_09660 [Bdellovibrionales bacterium]|nr:hypothetical protein [Bdellovibrionales bacterium]
MESFQHDANFSEYITCSRMYRNMSKFLDLNYTIQFGNVAVSSGMCKAPVAFPSCDQAASIPAGSFCKCRAGAPFAAVGCDPNDSNSDCFSMSLASNCEL